MLKEYQYEYQYEYERRMEEQIGFDNNFYYESESPESESNLNCTDTPGLGNLELSDVFQADIIQLLLCIGVAIVMVIPALSVYFRNTDESPRKSYKASCLVKFIRVRTCAQKY